MKMELYIVKPLLNNIIARVGFANFSFECERREGNLARSGVRTSFYRYSGRMAGGRRMREGKGRRGKLRAGLLPLRWQKKERRLEGKARQVFTHKETERESHGHWLHYSGMHQVSSAFVFRDRIYMHMYAYNCETVEDTLC